MVVRFTALVKNITSEPIETYISSYTNLLMKTVEGESEAKWYKRIEADERGYAIHSIEPINRNLKLQHYAYLSRSFDVRTLVTTSGFGFKGDYNAQLVCAKPLFNGRIYFEKPITAFDETAITGDLTRVTLAPGESYEMSWSLAIGSDPCSVKNAIFLDFRAFYALKCVYFEAFCSFHQVIFAFNTNFNTKNYTKTIPILIRFRHYTRLRLRAIIHFMKNAIKAVAFLSHMRYN